MSVLSPDHESSQSSSGYEDGLGRRVLAFDRETGGMLERLVLRPELTAFQQVLSDRIDLVAGLEDERFARPRAIERGDDRLVVVSEYVAGRRLSDIIESAGEHGIVAGLDASLGLLLELLPALARLHDAGLSHGALAPGRIMVTPAGLIVLLDSIYAGPLERLQLTRKRLWAEFRLAFPPTAGLARFDKAADLAHASMVAAALTVGRVLQDKDYPEGTAVLRQEILEIASIRGSKSFADAVDKFFASALPLAGRRTTPSADEAAIDLRKLVRKELGINTCRTALIEFFQQIEAADAERVLAEAAGWDRRVAEAKAHAAEQARLEADRQPWQDPAVARREEERAARARAEAERAEGARAQGERERLEAERTEKARADGQRADRKRVEAERVARERAEQVRAEAERLERERIEAERLEREQLEAERSERERAEQARLETERLQQERLDRERRDRERLEAERRERERAEESRREGDRIERERREAEQLERERIEAERRERDRLEAQRLEHERIEQARRESERAERERIEVERRERERVEAERLENERIAQARREAERLDRERLEAERRERERVEAERREHERIEQARLETERLERERLEKERIEKARLEAERLETERLERARLEKERIEKARLEAERLERERLEAERRDRERAEKARAEAERLERERVERERAEKARLEAERRDRERLEAERLERERAEVARLEAEQLERERHEAERVAQEARQKAERLERERLEAARQAEKARHEAERLDQQRAEAARRERERLEDERRAEEHGGDEEPQSAPAPEPVGAPSKSGWLIPPNRAAAFEPVPVADPPPAPPPAAARPYPVYVAPPEPAAWSAGAAPQPLPADFLAPVAEIGPGPRAPISIAPAPPSIRLKGDDAQARVPARAESRREPAEVELSAAHAYELFRTTEEKRSVPWKMIAAGVVLLAGAFAASLVYTRGGGPVADTVRKVLPESSAPDLPPVAANAGRLVITTQPAGAKVTIDGKAAGETPLTVDGVKPGRHVIALTSSEGSARRTVRVEGGQILTLDFPLYSGFAAISVPFVVSVSEGGKALGTNENQILLSPGRHTLRLANKELGYAATETVEIAAGEVTRLDLDPKGRANINAAPWAEVWIDGEKAGDTPLANVPIPLGVREIVFKNPQFPERKQTVTITANATATISVDFVK